MSFQAKLDSLSSMMPFKVLVDFRSHDPSSDLFDNFMMHRGALCFLVFEDLVSSVSRAGSSEKLMRWVSTEESRSGVTSVLNQSQGLNSSYREDKEVRRGKNGLLTIARFSITRLSRWGRDRKRPFSTGYGYGYGYASGIASRADRDWSS